jgi:hypothetical protein
MNSIQLPLNVDLNNNIMLQENLNEKSMQCRDLLKKKEELENLNKVNGHNYIILIN